MFKNVAGQSARFFAFNTTNNQPVAGEAGNITGYVVIDYAPGNPSPLAGSAVESSPTLAKGFYTIPLAQAESNGDTLGFSAVSSTPNVMVIGVPPTVFTTDGSISGSIAAILAGGAITVINPTDAEGTTKIISGDWYEDGVGHDNLRYVVSGYSGPSISGATVRWMAIPKGLYHRSGTSAAEFTKDTGSATLVSGVLTLKVPLTSSNTAALSHTSPPEPNENYVIVAQLIKAGATLTEVIAKGTVLKGLAAT